MIPSPLSLSFSPLFVVVECPLEPLQELENGSANLPAGKLGYKVSVSFQCVQGYRLAENTPRTCQLNGTWSGRQPHCESKFTSTSCSLQPLELHGFITCVDVYM